MNIQARAITLIGGDKNADQRLRGALETRGAIVANSPSEAPSVVIVCDSAPEFHLLGDGASNCHRSIRAALLEATAAAKEALDDMRRNSGGRLVLVLPAAHGLTAGAIRGGLTSFVRSAAVAYARENVAVNAVVADLSGDARELAAIVLYLASSEAAAMVGQVLP